MDTETLNRFDRIVAIFIHLQSGRVVKAQELADRFEVSLRTIYRDIKSLEASGVPVAGEAGVGYSLLEGYRLPPVMFTPEEASSFVAAEKLMQKFSDKSLGASFESAVFKVKSVLRANTKDQIAALETQVWVNNSGKVFNENTPDALSLIMISIAEKKQVALEYKSLYSEEASNRIIEPVGLFNEHNRWYIFAYCHLRQSYRQFRTDRMIGLKRTDKPFTQQHDNVADFRKQREMPEGETEVVIKVQKEFARFMESGRKYYGFVSENILADAVEMTFKTGSCTEGLARYYLMFGDCAEIISPESFREKVSELLEKATANLKFPTLELVG
ncbi:YafY family transcriptional regulator [Adhaeribacter sp. BT258]|uniref:YafY family transcriptional regulator n=1 Tax=Adhaeribacter terrigena TaxID=2793070 RepID=A0ABS1C434_9BACT|nr:YafY family protein [Adhaeribacter terrigena]MBK0404078.1 YafY family transcriptional regulator [Adhaeribacter terrigena]